MSRRCIIAALAALVALRHDLIMSRFIEHQKWEAHISVTLVVNFLWQ